AGLAGRPPDAARVERRPVGAIEYRKAPGVDEAQASAGDGERVALLVGKIIEAAHDDLAIEFAVGIGLHREGVREVKLIKIEVAARERGTGGLGAVSRIAGGVTQVALHPGLLVVRPESTV